MNREIKFRGKSLHTGEWHYGNLMQVGDACYIHEPGTAGFFTDPETVGQFTGMYDRKGKEIYEGDILKWDKYDTSKHFQIEYNHGGFGYWYYGEFYLLGGNQNFSFKPFNKDKDFEIIGNIHDNPELLKGDKQ